MRGSVRLFCSTRGLLRYFLWRGVLAQHYCFCERDCEIPNDPIQTVRQYMRSAARDGRQRKLCSDFFDRRFRSISGKPGYESCCMFANEGTREGRAAAAEGASNTDCVEIHDACRKER